MLARAGAVGDATAIAASVRKLRRASSASCACAGARGSFMRAVRFGGGLPADDQWSVYRDQIRTHSHRGSVKVAFSCLWTCGRGSAGGSLNRRRGEQGADRNPGACRTTGVGGRACEKVVARSVAAGLRVGGHAGEHRKRARAVEGEVHCSEVGWGLTRSCSLRPPAAGAWKKRGVPGEPDEYLPTACSSQACEESRGGGRRARWRWRRGPGFTCCRGGAQRRASAARRPVRRRQTAVVGRGSAGASALGRFQRVTIHHPRPGHPPLTSPTMPLRLQPWCAARGAPSASRPHSLDSQRHGWRGRRWMAGWRVVDGHVRMVDG